MIYFGGLFYFLEVLINIQKIITVEGKIIDYFDSTYIE